MLVAWRNVRFSLMWILIWILLCLLWFCFGCLILLFVDFDCVFDVPGLSCFVCVLLQLTDLLLLADLFKCWLLLVRWEFLFLVLRLRVCWVLVFTLLGCVSGWFALVALDWNPYWLCLGIMGFNCLFVWVTWVVVFS